MDTVMEHFNNTIDTKKGTDGQKLKKIQMDYDIRFTISQKNCYAEQFSKSFSFVIF